jgi:hypothetical protein
MQIFVTLTKLLSNVKLKTASYYKYKKCVMQFPRYYQTFVKLANHICLVGSNVLIIFERDCAVHLIKQRNFC